MSRKGGARIVRGVQAGRSLHEVITAANALLERKYDTKVAVGLSRLCWQLQQAAAGDLKGPGGAPASAGAATTSEGKSALQDGGSIGNGSNADQGDVYAVMSLLRRLLLWPVTADLLRETQAGKAVGKLKKHPNPQVHFYDVSHLIWGQEMVGALHFLFALGCCCVTEITSKS